MSTWDVEVIRISGRSADNSTFEFQKGMGQVREIDYQAWLLSSDVDRVIVDCGPAPQEGTGRGVKVDRGVGELLSSTAGLVTDVVLTHAHWDHMGGLRDFPHARIWMQQAEWDFIHSPYVKVPAIGRYYGNTSALREAHNEGRLRLVRGLAEIRPGIRVRWSGGHTPGHQTVDVDTPSGLGVVCGDLVPVIDNIIDGTLPGIYTDAFECVDAIERLVASRPQVLYTGHDRDAAVHAPDWARITTWNAGGTR